MYRGIFFFAKNLNLSYVGMFKVKLCIMHTYQMSITFSRTKYSLVEVENVFFKVICLLYLKNSNFQTTHHKFTIICIRTFFHGWFLSKCWGVILMIFHFGFSNMQNFQVKNDSRFSPRYYWYYNYKAKRLE